MIRLNLLKFEKPNPGLGGFVSTFFNYVLIMFPLGSPKFPSYSPKHLFGLQLQNMNKCNPQFQFIYVGVELKANHMG
jgi:hypothetical protein